MSDKNGYTEYTLKCDTQETVNQYLESIGMNPVDAVCGTARSLMASLMQDFIARGGTYEVVANKDMGNIYPHSYPRSNLKVNYGTRYYFIWQQVLQGMPVIVIKQPWKNQRPILMDILVHPDHLDATLCHLLEVPHKEIPND